MGGLGEPDFGIADLGADLKRLRGTLEKAGPELGPLGIPVTTALDLLDGWEAMLRTLLDLQRVARPGAHVPEEEFEAARARLDRARREHPEAHLLILEANLCLNQVI